MFCFEINQFIYAVMLIVHLLFGVCIRAFILRTSSDHRSKPVKLKPHVQIRLWSKELLWFAESKRGAYTFLDFSLVTACLRRQMMGERLKQESRVREGGATGWLWCRSSSEKQAERSQQGVEERALDGRVNLTRLPRIRQPSDTIDTFILFVILPAEMKPQRS